MNDLAAWLLDRLDEDEQAARATSPWPWVSNAEGDEVLSARLHDEGGLLEEDLTVATGYALSGNQVRANVAHIARHDPARVLAEVAAKRRIVELHTPTDRTGKHLCPVCVSWEIWLTQEPGAGLPLDDAPCSTLRLLALPYAVQPGYRPEWAP